MLLSVFFKALSSRIINPDIEIFAKILGQPETAHTLKFSLFISKIPMGLSEVYRTF